MPMRVPQMLLLTTLLPAVMAGEYDACGRPDAVYASWDQVIFSPPNHRHAPPRRAPNARCQPCHMDRATAAPSPALMRLMEMR